MKHNAYLKKLSSVVDHANKKLDQKIGRIGWPLTCEKMVFPNMMPLQGMKKLFQDIEEKLYTG